MHREQETAKGQGDLGCSPAEGEATYSVNLQCKGKRY